MPRDASDGLDGEHTFRRYASPFGDRAPGDAQGTRNPELQPVLSADQLHAQEDGGMLHDHDHANRG